MRVKKEYKKNVVKGINGVNGQHQLNAMDILNPVAVVGTCRIRMSAPLGEHCSFSFVPRDISHSSPFSILVFFLSMASPIRSIQSCWAIITDYLSGFMIHYRGGDRL